VRAGAHPRRPALNLSSSFFLLNPDGDLPATQNSFEGWLRQELGLQVWRRPAHAAGN
jgi:hypothetical protein